jgi:hypothetical protein
MFFLVCFLFHQNCRAAHRASNLYLTGQQHMPETLNGRIQADALPDMETLRRASVLP